MSEVNSSLTLSWLHSIIIILIHASPNQHTIPTRSLQPPNSVALTQIWDSTPSNTWLDPGLHDGQTPGCEYRHHHILHPDSQHCMLSPLLYSAHARLCDHPQLKHHHQDCWQCNCHRPDHRRQWGGPWRGRLGATRKPPSWSQQNKGVDCQLQEVTGVRTCPGQNEWDYGGESQQLQVPQTSHQQSS